jgi:hypothetical protein
MRRSPATRALALVITILAGLAAFAGTAGAAGTPPPPGHDPFYRTSRPLAPLHPGAVLRTRTVSIPAAGSSVRAVQLLYRTTGELGQPTVTVTTVILPAAPAPTPRKIVSYQTAYDALGPQCDPSYNLQGGGPVDVNTEQQAFLLPYVKAGYAVVVSDYEGENLDWTAGQESGYGTLDGILAAEHYLHLKPASTPVGMEGYSGGSIATEFAAELAPKYAPSLDIVATAAGGVPVDLLHNLAYINGSPVWSGTIPASTLAIARAVGLNFGPALSPYGRKVLGQVAHACITTFLGAYPGLTIDKLFKPPYRPVVRDLPSFVSVSDHLIMGRSGTPKGPLLLAVGNADGTGDGVMVARDVQGLAHDYCRRGVSVEFHEYSGDTHTLAAIPFESAASAFLKARLNGQPVANGCAQIAAGNSIAPAPVPQAKLLHIRWLGRRGAHDVAVQLWAPHRAQRTVAVTLAFAGRVFGRVRLSRIGRARVTVVLAAPARTPAPGVLTLTVTIRGGGLIWEPVSVG